MGAVEDAQAQLAAAQQLAAERAAQAQEAQQKLAEQQQQQQSQQALRQASLANFGQRAQAQAQIQQGQEQVQNYLNDIKSYQQNVLNPAQQQISDYQEAVARQEMLQATVKQMVLGGGFNFRASVPQDIINQAEQIARGYDIGAANAMKSFSVPQLSSIPMSFVNPNIPGIHSFAQVPQNVVQAAPNYAGGSSYGVGQSVINALNTGASKIIGFFENPLQNAFINPKPDTTPYLSPNSQFSPQSLANQGFNVQQNINQKDAQGNPTYTISYIPPALNPSDFNAQNLQISRAPSFDINAPFSSLRNVYNDIAATNAPHTAYDSQGNLIAATATPNQYGGTPTLLNPKGEYSSYQSHIPKIFQYPAQAVFSMASDINQLLGGQPTSYESQVRGGEALGSLGLWGWASPLFATGTAAIEVPQEAVQGELIYDNIRQRWVRINRLTGQTIEIDQATGLPSTISDFNAGVQKGLLNSKDAGEQTKFLNKIYETYFKNQPNGAESFQKLAKDMYDNGFYKGIPLDFYQKAPLPIKKSPLFEIRMNLPPKLPTGEVGSAFNIETAFANQPNAFGKFDDTNKFGTFNPTNVLGSVNFNEAKDRFSEINKEFEKLQFKNYFEQLSKLKTNTITKPDFDTLIGLKSQTKTNTITKPDLATLTSLLSLMKTQTKQKIQQQFRQEIQQRTQQRLKYPFPRLRIPSGNQKKQKAVDMFLGDLYEVYTKRKGKEVLLARGKNLPLLESLGISKITSTLARSLIVKRNGQEIPISNPNPFIFRPSKSRKNPFAFVEKNPLKFAGEKREIQQARRSAPRKIKGGRKKFSLF